MFIILFFSIVHFLLCWFTARRIIHFVALSLTSCFSELFYCSLASSLRLSPLLYIYTYIPNLFTLSVHFTDAWSHHSLALSFPFPAWSPSFTVLPLPAWSPSVSLCPSLPGLPQSHSVIPFPAWSPSVLPLPCLSWPLLPSLSFYAVVRNHVSLSSR